MMNPYEHRERLDLGPLSDQVAAILQHYAAPPRLVAHLLLVHAVAIQLCAGIRQRWPALPLDGEAVQFGAAVHYIGKVAHPDELIGPGQEHARAGPELLLQAGVPPAHARFACTHGTWRHEPDLPIEDLLVALADSCWRGARDTLLEDRIAAQIAAASGCALWEAVLSLEDLIEGCAASADARLAWQAQFPAEL